MQKRPDDHLTARLSTIVYAATHNNMHNITHIMKATEAHDGGVARSVQLHTKIFVNDATQLPKIW